MFGLASEPEGPSADLLDHQLVMLTKMAIELEGCGYPDAGETLSFSGIEFRVLLLKERERMATVDRAFAHRQSRIEKPEDWKRFVREMGG